MNEKRLPPQILDKTYKSTGYSGKVCDIIDSKVSIGFEIAVTKCEKIIFNGYIQRNCILNCGFALFCEYHLQKLF